MAAAKKTAARRRRRRARRPAARKPAARKKTAARKPRPQEDRRRKRPQRSRPQEDGREAQAGSRARRPRLAGRPPRQEDGGTQAGRAQEDGGRTQAGAPRRRRHASRPHARRRQRASRGPQEGGGTQAGRAQEDGGRKPAAREALSARRRSVKGGVGPPFRLFAVLRRARLAAARDAHRMTASSTDSPALERTPSRARSSSSVRDAAGCSASACPPSRAQTYPRLGVLAVDDASTDGSRDLLDCSARRRAGSSPRRDRRSRRLRARGARDRPVAAGADYLLLHDDTALDPERSRASSRRRSACGRRGRRDRRRQGRRLGPPALAAGRRPLRRSVRPPVLAAAARRDRSGPVRSRPRGAVRVVVRDARRPGASGSGPDCSTSGSIADHEDLDFCWRARLAGFRVLMTPLARAPHRRRDRAPASAPGDATGGRSGITRSGRPSPRCSRTTRLPSLLWVLPLALLLGRSAWCTSCSLDGSRSARPAGRVGMEHRPPPGHPLPAACGRSRARRCRIANFRRFMESAGSGCRAGSPRRGGSSRSSARSRSEDEGEPSADGSATGPLRSSAHIRSSSPRSSGRWWPRSRSGASSGRGRCTAGPCRRSPVRGRASSASWPPAIGRPDSVGRSRRVPALGAMGGLSWLSFGSTTRRAEGVARRRARSSRRSCCIARSRGSPAVRARPCSAAVSYGLSAMVLWALLRRAHRTPGGALRLARPRSSGWSRVRPRRAARRAVAVHRRPRRDARGRVSRSCPAWRWPLGVLVVVQVALRCVTRPRAGDRGGGVRRRRGAPVPVRAHHDLRRRRGPGSRRSARRTSARWRGSALGGGPGTWSIAAFLPIAAVLAFSLVGPEHRGVASRAVLSAAAGLALAWCSSAGYLPAWAANAPIYLALAAVGEALVVGLGLSSVLSGLGRESFGLRQIGTALLAAVLGAGILLQTAAVMVGGWAVGGPDALPPAWAVVSSSAKGEFRVIWMGADTEAPFDAPGGDPIGVVPNGASSLRYGLTGREGIVATDTGRTLTGSGETLPVRGAGRDRVGVDDPRWCVARSARRALRGRAGGRSAGRGRRPVRRAGRSRPGGRLGTHHLSERRAGPTRRRLPRRRRRSTRSSRRRIWVRSSDCRRSVRRRSPPSRADGRGRHPRPGRAVVSTEFGPDWGLEGSDGAIVGPREAFGWSTAFDAPAGAVRVRFTEQWVRTVETLRAGSALAGGVVDHAEAGVAMRSQRHAAPGTRGRGQGLLLPRRARRGRRRRVRAPARRRPPRPRARRSRRRPSSGAWFCPARRGTEAMEGHPVSSRTPATRRSSPGSRRSPPRKPANAAVRHRAAASDRLRDGAGRRDGRPPRRGVLRRMGRGVVGRAGRRRRDRRGRGAVRAGDRRRRGSPRRDDRTG